MKKLSQPEINEIKMWGLDKLEASYKEVLNNLLAAKRELGKDFKKGKEVKELLKFKVELKKRLSRKMK